MPQDIPLEASERLAFTPPSVAHAQQVPVFHLRAATTREKRFRRRILLEEGVTYHHEDTQRQEVLKALRTKLWGPEKFETHKQPLLDYWEALDDFRAQRKDNPELEWSYDTETEEAVLKLLRDVEANWPPIGSMRADNADFNEIFLAATVAAVVERVTGLDCPTETDRGYLTIDSVDRMAQRLSRLAQRNALPDTDPKLAGQIAWLELVNACQSRMALDEDEEKNSASPSPSETIQAASSETETLEKDGAFLAAATEPTPSTETLASS